MEKKLKVTIDIYIDVDEYVEPTPKYEDDPRGFLAELVKEWVTYGFNDEQRFRIRCAGLDEFGDIEAPAALVMERPER